MDTNRLVINNYDLSTSNEERQTVVKGFTVIDSPKGGITPIRISQGGVSKIKDIFGVPTAEYPEIFEAQTFNVEYDCYISAPYSDAKVPVAYVTDDGIVQGKNLVTYDKSVETLINDFKEDVECDGITMFSEGKVETLLDVRKLSSYTGNTLSDNNSSYMFYWPSDTRSERLNDASAPEGFYPSSEKDCPIVGGKFSKKNLKGVRVPLNASLSELIGTFGDTVVSLSEKKNGTSTVFEKLNLSLVVKSPYLDSPITVDLEGSLDKMFEGSRPQQEKDKAIHQASHSISTIASIGCVNDPVSKAISSAKDLYTYLVEEGKQLYHGTKDNPLEVYCEVSDTDTFGEYLITIENDEYKLEVTEATDGSPATYTVGKKTTSTGEVYPTIADTDFTSEFDSYFILKNEEIAHMELEDISQNGKETELVLYLNEENTDGKIAAETFNTPDRVDSLEVYFVKNTPSEEVRATIFPKYPSDRDLHLSFAPFNALDDYASDNPIHRNRMTMTVYEDGAFHDSSMKITIRGSIDPSDVDRNGAPIGFSPSNESYDIQSLVGVYCVNPYKYSDDIKNANLAGYQSVTLSGGYKRTVTVTDTLLKELESIGITRALLPGTIPTKKDGSLYTSLNDILVDVFGTGKVLKDGTLCAIGNNVIENLAAFLGVNYSSVKKVKENGNSYYWGVSKNEGGKIENKPYLGSDESYKALKPVVNATPASRCVNVCTKTELHNKGWEELKEENGDMDVVDICFESYGHSTAPKADDIFFTLGSYSTRLSLSGYIYNYTIAPSYIPTQKTIGKLGYGSRYWNICNEAIIAVDGNSFSRVSSPMTGARARMQARIIDHKFGGAAPMYLNSGSPAMGGQLSGMLSVYGTVKSMKYSYDKDAQEELNNLNFNPVIKDHTYGLMLTGQKTSQDGAVTDWSYIGHVAAFLNFEKEVREYVMLPQLGKANNEYYRNLRKSQVEQLLNGRLSGANKIWAAASVDTSTADGVNDIYALRARKFVINVRVKVDIFSETVELNFSNVDQAVQIQ